jgi:hypothetical protein
MYLCIIILPFLSFLSCFFFGRYIGIAGSCVVSTGAIMSAAFIALFMVYETAIYGSCCSFIITP